jgi:hypothetical protein
MRRGFAESCVNTLLTPRSRLARNRGWIGFILADVEVDLSPRRLDCRERGIGESSMAEGHLFDDLLPPTAAYAVACRTIR